MVRNVGVILVLAAMAWSCETEFADESFADEQLQAGNRFYFLDASLQFEEEDTVFVLQQFVDLDPSTPLGLNETLISRTDTVTEVYSVFNAGNTMLDNGPSTTTRLDTLHARYGFTYGSVSYAGLGFCFFLPATGVNAEFASVMLDSMLQPGNTLNIGTSPGDVEIGYYKNFPGFGDADHHGFISSPMSNDSGIFTVEEVRPALDIDGQTGYQIQISFNCRLFKQYTSEGVAELEGTAVIFVPSR